MYPRGKKDIEKMKTNEEALIKRVKAGDDQALKKLFSLYKPLVSSILKKYYLYHYEYKDWQQDALIICYEAALIYSAEKGRFGSLYKTKLSNHARTLVRYNMALRRQVYSKTVSWEKVDMSVIQEPRRFELAIPIDDTYNNFVKSLSRLELIALLIVLGEMSTEYAVEKFGLEAMQLVRARSRTLQKMRNVLL